MKLIADYESQYFNAEIMQEHLITFLMLFHCNAFPSLNKNGYTSFAGPLMCILKMIMLSTSKLNCLEVEGLDVLAVASRGLLSDVTKKVAARAFMFLVLG